MNIRWLVLLSIIILSVSGCKQFSLDDLSDKDLKRISENAVICNKPYLRVGLECCLDKNGDKICDDDKQIPGDVDDVPKTNHSTDKPPETPSENKTNPERDNPPVDKKPRPPREDPVKVPNPPSQGSAAGISNPNLIIKLPALSLPLAGKTFTDPAFGTKLRRLTDAVNGNRDRHVYSQLQAFNKDNSRILMDNSQNYLVREVDSLKISYAFDTLIYAPRWNPLNKEEIIYFTDLATEPTEVELEKINVFTGIKTKYNFPINTYRWVSPGRAISYEEISRDGRWLTLFVQKRSNDHMVFVLFDLINNKVERELDLAGRCSDINPNWVAPSPLKGDIVIQWNPDGEGACNGVEVYDRTTGQYKGHVGSHRGHSDMGIDENNNEIYVTYGFQNSLFITVTKFPGSANFKNSYDKIILDVGWGHFSHLSCQGPKGVCVVTADTNTDAPVAGGEPLHNEIYLVYTSGRAEEGNNAGAKIRRLAHHRSSNCDYYHEPQASISADGSYIIFASDGGNCNSGADSYLIDLRGSDLSAPPSSGGPTGGIVIEPPNDDSDEEETEPENQNQLPEENLGVNGLPAQTYNLDNDDVFTLGIAEGQWYAPPVSVGKDFVRLLVTNEVGMISCEATDFTNIRLFYSPSRSNQYTKVANSQILEHDGGGCNKWNQMYAVSLQGSNDIVACVSQEDDSQNYCTEPVQITTNPKGVEWG
ncbi:hypothetical protein J4421_00605 [Candidatus Woesearchaeota archaeon]|nr:hypothetical protein [Candidatus Woesearchaeota archaeon]